MVIYYEYRNEEARWRSFREITHRKIHVRAYPLGPLLQISQPVQNSKFDSFLGIKLERLFGHSLPLQYQLNVIASSDFPSIIPSEAIGGENATASRNVPTSQSLATFRGSLESILHD